MIFIIKLIKSNILTILVLLLTVGYLGISKYTYLSIKYLNWVDPSLRSISQEIKTNTAFWDKNTTVEVGIEKFTFQSPWGNVSDIKNIGSGKIIYFKNGVYLFIYGEKKIIDKTLIKISKINKSQYDLFTSIINSSPQDITLMSPNSLGEKLLKKLIAKQLLTLSIHPVYNFELADVKSYQIGDPSKDKKIILYVFEKDAFYQIHIGVRRNSQYLLNQSDLNTIITSLRTAK